MRMGYLPFVAAGAALVETVSGVFAAKAQQEAYDKAVKAERAKQRKLEEQRRLELARTQAQQQQALALQLSQQRRQEQTMALAVVGGVAIVISGLFLMSALKKKPVARKT